MLESKRAHKDPTWRMLLTGIIWGLHWSIHKMSNSFFLNLTWKPLRSQTHFHTEDEIKQFHFHICWCFITLLMLVLSRVSHVQFFVTLWTIARQALLSMGFSRQKHWNGLPCPPPGDFPNPGIESVSPALWADSLSPEPLGKASDNITQYKF